MEVRENRSKTILIHGEWKKSLSKESTEIIDPSTGEEIARIPYAVKDELNEAVESAHQAYLGWSRVPVMKRVPYLSRFSSLIEEHLDELVELLSREEGKVLEEARGDVLKAKEICDFACGAPTLMMGETVMNSSSGFDTHSWREPIGVFLGLPPFNFPAMIPFGWMIPLCIVTGNTMVLKVSPKTPLTALRMAELLQDTGLPPGVVNVVSCDNQGAETLLRHPKVRGVSFVGSTAVGRRVYQIASEEGKRVQTLCSAKNHGLVLVDADLEKSGDAIIRSAFGCAGQRCMALPVAVVQEGVADSFIEIVKNQAAALNVGIAYDPKTGMGPVISPERISQVEELIEDALSRGASMVLDGRGIRVEEGSGGFYMGPTILDRVSPEMRISREEVFGPVLSIIRVPDFESGLRVMNADPYGNGSVIFTSSGRYAREFTHRTDAGMVGVNVGIPVPISIFPFSGHKNSFFGDLHTLGKDGIRFFTETKCVTTRWFDTSKDDIAGDGTWGGTV